ncbi:MAG: hypothetical protein M3119_02390 [Verrucomicrobiota bacterium]|nr:hypothetical protein [Verrucomicrobiota bacterium]
MFELKTLTKEGIPAALEKAERYRLLNEPAEAESICLDVLKIAPDNQEAITSLLLAVTDRFSKGYAVSDTQAKELLGKLKGDYERHYFSGLLSERRAKAKLAQGGHAAAWAYDLFREAMECYEKAEAIRPPGNDDTILRWNTCARIIDRNKLVPREEDRVEPAFD